MKTPSKPDDRIIILGPLLAYHAGEMISQGDILAENLRESGYSVLTSSHKPGRIQKLIDILLSIFLWRKEYDKAILMVFSGGSFIITQLSSMVLKLLNKPLILWLHGGNLPEFSNKHPKWVKMVFKRAEHVIAPSSYLKDNLRLFRSNIIEIPNPIDLNIHPYKHRVSPKPKLIWVRAFHDIYNPTLAPKIVNHLATDYPDITLTMVGPDKSDGSLENTKQLSIQLEVKDKISFPGFVSKSQVPKWLNTGDIFINTTNIDNTPLSVLEAMACGLCIVSTNVGGIPYLLEDEVDALLVPPDDPVAMANAIIRILRDPELSSKLSLSARRKAENFSWDCVLPQWEILLDDIHSNL